MKKLIVLTAVVMLTACAAGCQCGRWFRRGAAAPCCPPGTSCDPYAPSGPCDSCTAPTFESAPTITPSPETYVPAPTG